MTNEAGAQALNDYQSSSMAVSARLTRGGITKVQRKKLLTKTQCAILRRVMNLWFAHANSSGIIHPGCQKTAKLVGCCEKTCRVAFQRFEALGIMLPRGLEKGGAGATRYAVDVVQFWKFSGSKMPEEIPGILIATHRWNSPKSGPVVADQSHQTPVKITDDIIDVSPLAWVGKAPDGAGASHACESLSSEELRASALYDVELLPIQEEVLLVILSCILHGDGAMSTRAIARAQGMSRRQAAKHISILVGSGMVEVITLSRMRQHFTLGSAFVSELEYASAVPF